MLTQIPLGDCQAKAYALVTTCTHKGSKESPSNCCRHSGAIVYNASVNRISHRAKRHLDSSRRCGGFRCLARIQEQIVDGAFDFPAIHPAFHEWQLPGCEFDIEGIRMLADHVDGVLDQPCQRSDP